MSRKSLSSRVLSIIVSIVMVVSMAPIAWAAEAETSDSLEMFVEQHECDTDIVGNAEQDSGGDNAQAKAYGNLPNPEFADDSDSVSFPSEIAGEQEANDYPIDQLGAMQANELASADMLRAASSYYDRIVYLARSNGSIYHYSEDCSGMVRPNAVTLQEALDRGCRPCEKCVAPPQSISAATISAIPNAVYTGFAQEPALTVRCNGKTLQAGEDYEVTYSNNIMPGTATVIVTGKYDYTGTVSTTFKIVARNLSEGFISPISDVVSTGIAQKPGITVKCNGRILRVNEDYSAVYANNVGPGTATVTVTGKGGYTGTLSSTFRIVQSDLKFDGTIYHITSKADSSFVLDVAKAVPEVGSNVSVWTDNGGENQFFTLEVAADGNVLLRNVANPSLVLDAAGAAPEAGANVSTWTYNGGLNQEWSIRPMGGSSYSIASVANPELVLDAAGSPPSAGANVGLWTDNGGANQRWAFTEVSVEPPSLPDGVVAGAIYRIASASDDGLILDVAKAMPEAGSNVSVWASNGGQNQLFKVGLSTDGFVVLWNVANPSLVLDAAGGIPKAGANVSTWTYNGGKNQKWVLRSGDDGTVTIVSAANRSLVLDASGNPASTGSNVGLWTDNGGMNQLWRFVPADDLAYADVSVAGMAKNATGGALSPKVDVSLNGKTLRAGTDYAVTFDGSPSAPSAVGTYHAVLEGRGSYSGAYDLGDFTIHSAPIAAGSTARYHLASGFSDAYVLDVAAAMPEIGANVSIWTDNGGSNQLFTLELQGDGFYVLRNVANPLLVLDAAGAVPEVGANVSTWSYNGGMNQKWVLIPSDERPGYYRIASASDTEFVLDAAGAAPKAGANVSIWYDNGGPNQLWKPVRAS